MSDVLTGCNQVLFVTDSALQTLPPALLGNAATGWLVRRFAIAIMPSLDAVMAAAARPESASLKAFLGIGDPALFGAWVLMADRGSEPR